MTRPFPAIALLLLLGVLPGCAGDARSPSHGSVPAPAEAAEEPGSAAGGSVLPVVLAPSLMMLLGSAAVMQARIPQRIQACTQNFSGGLLIAAVAGELFPLMSAPQTAAPQMGPVTEYQSYVGLCSGFVLGLLFMFGLEHLTEGGDSEDDGEFRRQLSNSSTTSMEAPLLSVNETEELLTKFGQHARHMQVKVQSLDESLKQGARERIDEIVHDLTYQVDKAGRLLARTEALDERNLARMMQHAGELEANCEALRQKTTVADAKAALKVFRLTLEHIHHHTHRVKFRRWNPAPKPDKETPLPERIPWSEVLAVTVDSAVDGVLIGLAFTASASAGWCMSIATCIEMGFLGLSFSATLQTRTRSFLKHVALVILPPLVLALAGVSGHGLGSWLEESPGLFIGFVAFSIVALLFLVTQELLAEAREKGGDDFLINIMLFIGVLAGILLEKALG